MINTPVSTKLPMVFASVKALWTKAQCKTAVMGTTASWRDFVPNDEEENMDPGSDSQDGSDPGEKPSSSEDDLREKLLYDYNKLKAEFDKLSEENAKLKRLQAERLKVPTPTKPASNSLTKPQLYMAIKKYLGPTMAALLRIEMFGGSEDRTWKEDEREFAIELLQLGDEVYKYCCDEWRFRLPPLRTARSWLEKKKTEDVEDFLDL